MNKKYLLHLSLFILTIVSTYITWGFWYCLFIMSILSAHELGHYLTSRKYGIPASLPFFIPFPFPPFGTLGAVIKMKGIISNRKVLFDIGASGPIAGLIFTIPAIIIGLKLSPVVPLSQLPPDQVMSLGDSLLFSWIQYLVTGKIPAGYDILLHPIAYAGWVGLFVTALNLLPIGQLDGGHIIYSLWGEQSRLIFKFIWAVLAGICIFFNPGWILLVIILFFWGLKHPPPMDYITPLDKRRKRLGLFIMLFFIISFTPIPFHIAF